MSFLTARWQKLAIANYEYVPAALERYLPAGTELDLWQGKCYVSLIGFRFLDTAVLGWKIPFHTHFEEVNLRFYVRRFDGAQWKRGVVFIKEIVPRPAIALVANRWYRERYQTLPMRHRWHNDGISQQIEYQWKAAQKWQTIRVEAAVQPLPMPPGSEVEFITEHYWGYARKSERETVEYEVRHPRWHHYAVKNWEIDVDFGQVYGPEFAALQQAAPASVMLAEGSPVSVEGKRIIRLE